MKLEEKYIINEGWKEIKNNIIKDKKIMKLVHEISRKLNYDIWQTAAFILELMDDVNMHKEARKVEQIFDQEFKNM